MRRTYFTVMLVIDRNFLANSEIIDDIKKIGKILHLMLFSIQTNAAMTKLIVNAMA